MWRLPALVVDDFDAVTPELLHSAYVEALYRAEEFEFQRLKQSWWWEFISEVSSTKSSQPLYDRFPPEAQDSTFTRPLVDFSCWDTNSCGRGTKRIPKKSC